MGAIDIVGLLPQRNCGDCGEPLCITFAAQLLGGKRTPDGCPHLTEQAAATLLEALEPPVRRIVVGNGRGTVAVGEERVLHRHELRFFHPTAIAVTLDDALSAEEQEARLSAIGALSFSRLGQTLSIDMVAVRSVSGDAEAFAQTVRRATKDTNLPLALIASDSAVMREGLAAAPEEHALIVSADPTNWEAMAELARTFGSPLVVEAAPADLEGLVSKVRGAGVEDLVLAPRSGGSQPFSTTVADLVELRTLAVAEHRLGYPTLAYPARSLSAEETVSWGSALLAKYASFLVLEEAGPEVLYPLLALRQAIFTDPTVPTTVEAGLYTEGSPDAASPLLLTGNFAMTYSMVSSDVRSAGLKAHVLVADAQGYSVGVACLLGTITPEQVAELLDATGAKEKVSHRRLVIPGLMESLKDKLAEATGFEIMVGPLDSKHLPAYVEENWTREAPATVSD